MRGAEKRGKPCREGSGPARLLGLPGPWGWTGAWTALRCLLPFAGLSLPFLFQPLHTLVPKHILVGGDCCVVVLGCDGL